MDEKEFDYGFLKDTIAQIPEQRIKYAADPDTNTPEKVLCPQDVVDMSYDATLQNIMLEIPCSVYEKSYEQYVDRNTIGAFLHKTTNTDKLQERNVLLTSSFWKDIILEPKENITSGYRQRTIDATNKRINYSELSACITSDCSVKNPVLTTIQFDFENSSDKTIGALKIASDQKELWDKLFSKYAKAIDVGAIKATAQNAIDFSIHKYYLPDTIENTDEATLLVRYDHCSLKHKNGTMPKLYRHVYPQSVNEPHFHFNSGFGGLYKLNSDGETYNYGVGYAIGVTDLKNYLEKLVSGNFKDKAEERLYSENDFGMPFLHLLSMGGGCEKIGDMVEKLTALKLANELGSQAAELEIAVDLINDFTNTEEMSLEYKGVNLSNSENDGMGAR